MYTPATTTASSGETVAATSTAGIDARSGPTIGIASVIAAMRPSSSAPGRPRMRVRHGRRRAHRAHQDELAADPQTQPRLDPVPGVARAGATLGGQEGQHVAL